MESKLLLNYGLKSYLAGSDYNFRMQTTGLDFYKKECLRALEDATMPTNTIHYALQVHSKNVEYCSTTNDNPNQSFFEYPDCDGLIVEEANVSAMVKFADCTPIVLFDPDHLVYAVLHSGWKGTVQKISLEAIEKLKKKYNTKVENLIAFVGPSIDSNNYEVGQEVFDAFQTIGNRQEYFRPGKREGKYYLSMVESNAYILRQAGILEKHIEISDRSTFTDSSLHSARKEGPNYQLNALFVSRVE